MILKNKYKFKIGAEKLIFTFILTLSFVFYTAPIRCQIQNDKITLKKFSEKIYFTNNIQMDSVYKYIKVHNTLKNNTAFEKHLEYWLEMYKEQIVADFENFTFLSYKEIKQIKNLKKISLHKDLVYKNKKNVYYMTNEEKNELVGPFILKKNKIIAILPLMNISGNDDVYPLLFNKRETLKYIITVNKYLGL